VPKADVDKAAYCDFGTDGAAPPGLTGVEGGPIVVRPRIKQSLHATLHCISQWVRGPHGRGPFWQASQKSQGDISPALPLPVDLGAATERTGLAAHAKLTSRRMTGTRMAPMGQWKTDSSRSLNAGARF
jgi:hypothetical protein